MFPSNVFNNTIKHFVENICRCYEKRDPVYDRKTTILNTIEEVRIKYSIQSACKTIFN